MNQEQPWGWARLGCAFAGLALLPVWGLLTAFVLYAELEMEMSRAPLAGLVAAVMVVLVAGLIAALLLVVRGAAQVAGMLRDRSARRRYQALAGDGGVLRDDAWGAAVLEGEE